MLSVRLKPEIEERLDLLAKATGRTKAYYAREAILEHLEDMEDRYLAERRLEQAEKEWSLEELELGHDLES